MCSWKASRPFKLGPIAHPTGLKIWILCWNRSIHHAESWRYRFPQLSPKGSEEWPIPGGPMLTAKRDCLAMSWSTALFWMSLLRQIGHSLLSVLPIKQTMTARLPFPPSVFISVSHALSVGRSSGYSVQLEKWIFVVCVGLIGNPSYVPYLYGLTEYGSMGFYNCGAIHGINFFKICKII